MIEQLMLSLRVRNLIFFKACEDKDFSSFPVNMTVFGRDFSMTSKFIGQSLVSNY